jgi:hypothetical protein
VVQRDRAYGSVSAMGMKIGVNAADDLPLGIDLILIGTRESDRRKGDVNAHMFIYEIRQQEIIGIEKGNERAVGVIQSRSKRSILSSRDVVRNHTKRDTGFIVINKISNFVDGIIFRMIIDDNALDLRVSLIADGLKAILNIFGIIVVRNDNRDLRRGRVGQSESRIEDFYEAL